MKTRSWKEEIWNPEAGLWPYIALLCLQMAGFYPSKMNTTCGAYCVYERQMRLSFSFQLLCTLF